MKLLLHCCCGPCTTAPVDHWSAQEAEVRGWFFNPNIHPAEERRRRRETFTQAAEAGHLPTRPAGRETSLLEFLLVLAQNGENRCRACYRLRLKATAQEALRSGCEAFSTTLLISPYQDLEALREIGEEIAADTGVGFAFADLRGQFQKSRERAQEMEWYQQNYCGCLFSNLERSERRALRKIKNKKAKMVNPCGAEVTP